MSQILWKTSQSTQPPSNRWLKLLTSVLSTAERHANRLVGTKGEHFLWVDLIQFKFGQGEVVHYSVDVDVDTPTWNRLEEVLKIMVNLKQFIKANSLLNA